MTEYWQRIKSVLDTAERSWTWFGNQLGIEQSNLSKKIKAGSYPDADTHNQICNLLGVTNGFLFNGTDAQFNPALLDIYVQLPSLNPQQADAVRALLCGFKNSSLLKN